jgi:hypothetical protein
VLADHAPTRANEACLGRQRLQLIEPVNAMLPLGFASNAIKVLWVCWQCFNA